MPVSPRRILILLVCLCFRLTGTADASGFRYQFLPDPVTGLSPLEVEATDGTLPDGWRFHPVTPNGDFPTGRGSVSVDLDPETGRILETYREGDVEVRAPLVLTPEEYNQVLTGRTFQKLWHDKSKTKRSVARNTAGFSGTGLRFEAPVQLPSIVRKIVGDGAPAIEISGSETITLSGTSDWTVSEQIFTERQKQSAFPSLEMKQELNVNLTGSIGDKIKVDVDQSSNVSTTLDNKVKLRYEGNEDDMIRSVELGNTNLSVEGASFRQEGLFGIKTVAKLGNVDLQTIASKQEGKTETARFTPTGELKREIIFDLQYIPRQYFLIAGAPIDVDYTTLQVWRDDAIQSNNVGTTKPGYARLDPNRPWDSADPTNFHVQGNFDLLIPNQDYDIRDDLWITGSDRKVPVLVLRRSLNTSEVLGVTYTHTEGGQRIPVGNAPANEDSITIKAIKVRPNDLLEEGGFYDPRDPRNQTLLYELRNFYDIRGRDISMETLTLRVRRIDAGASTHPERDVEGTQYIEILGLDQKSKPGSSDVNAPDGGIDDQYINPETGIIFFPDAHPFAPDTSFFLDQEARERVTSQPPKGILSETGEAEGRLWNPNVYYSPLPDLQRDVRYFIEAEFKSSTQGFSLGRFDIMEDSEQVKVDGIPQQRGRDYNIDYTTGQITFTRPPGPNQTISVDYSYAPGFGSTQMTLLGAAASYVPGPNLSITSSVLYDSRGAQDRRPKLGEEPARSLIGDLSSVVTFRPVWMTRMANLIPGIRTNSPSTLNIQGHAAVSNPNPNTEGEAYLDDMEGNRETVTASLSRTQWFWSAIPTFEAPVSDTDPNLPAPPTLVSAHLDLQWYNARNVKERDLKPVLLDAEGGDNEHQTLELNVLPPATDTTGVVTESSWTGITQSISSVGQDLSKLRFLEIWVNDFHPYPFHTDVKGKLHINFGRISEDAFWDPDTLPNGRLDTEDKNGDSKLDRSDDLSLDEDTGLDGVHSVNEDGYSPSNRDPNRDDYYFNPDQTPLDYSGINNMERNGVGEQTARPDTEDLNRDGFADFQNGYFEAVIDLADTSRFVSVDVSRDYAALEDAGKLEHPIAPLNGWRLYRIPINDEVFRRSSTSASWTNVQHMRLWVNGANQPLRIQIGGVELVGNRWLADAIDSAATDRGLQLFVGSRNNKDDAGFYEPPYDPENATGSTATEREQSLALRFTGLQEGDSLLAFRTSTDAAATGLGWTQYGEVRFWAHAVDPATNSRDVPAALLEDLRVLARFGPDTVNYYEYSAPLRPGWNKVVIPMQRLSSVKESGQRDTTGARFEIDPETGEVFRAVGNPSFTRIIRTSFGVTRTGQDAISDAELWIDDLRLASVKRDRGMRGDLSVQASFADVLALNVSYENQDENFVRVTNSANQGTGMKREAMSVATTFQLDKIMPTSGVQLPVRFSFARATDVPKFRTGSDVTLSPTRSALESNIQNRQSVDVSYRRTGPRKGFARYTIDAISGGMNYTRSGNQSVNSLDSSWAFNASGNYDLPLGGGGLGLFGKRMTLSFLPEVIGLNFNWQSTRDLKYSRFLFADRDTDSTVVRSDVKQRLLTLGGNASWTPLSSVRLRFGVRSLRNMLLHEEGLLGFNKGTEIDHSRTLELNYAPKWLSLLQPNITMNGRYHENSRPELQTLGSDSTGLKNIDNSGSARVTATVPFGRFAQKLAPPPGKGNVSYFTPVRAVLSRLQDVQLTFNMERGSSVSRVYGDAGFWFETGFTEVFDRGLEESPNSVFAASRSYTTGANTTFRPVQTMTLDARADHRLSFTDGNFGSRRTLSRTLPDLKGRWLELQRLLGLESSLSTMSINSGYVVRVEETGPENGAVEIRTTTTNFQPLMGWDLAWRDGLRANVSTSFIDAVSVDHRLNDVTGDRETLNTEVRFTKTFPASRGIRLPFSSNPIRLPNDLNLNLTFNSITDRKVTIRPRSGMPDIVEIDQTRWNVATATNYNFTNSISGGFNAAYRATNDRKTKIETRGITLGLNAQFRF
ncbi:MAG TPA: cell surface protein SprA [Candidatus Eisenbacteria bacterium]|nr:cell surface protein SprA [Candidatus Eisenbacteria bacterium]